MRTTKRNDFVLACLTLIAFVMPGLVIPQTATPQVLLDHGMAKPVGKRDPFRSIAFEITSPCREKVLSPLQQVNLSELKLVAIIWDIGEPRAMVEDSTGLGYVVKLGTPIGKCHYEGKVKAIKPHEVVIAEKLRDPISGANKTREVKMKLPS